MGAGVLVHPDPILGWLLTSDWMCRSVITYSLTSDESKSEVSVTHTDLTTSGDGEFSQNGALAWLALLGSLHSLPAGFLWGYLHLYPSLRGCF